MPSITTLPLPVTAMWPPWRGCRACRREAHRVAIGVETATPASICTTIFVTMTLMRMRRRRRSP